MLKNKSPQESAVEKREIVMPNQVNPHGVVFGGQIMAWIDLAAAMVAERHAESPVATVHVDSITFKHPIRVGNHVRILARVNYAGKTSMEIGVKVVVENPYTGISQTTTQANITMVATDVKGRPQPVHGLVPSSDEEKKSYQAALARKSLREK